MRSRAPAGVRRAISIDMHSHFLPRDWPDYAAKHGGAGWPSMRHEGALPAGTYGYGRECAAMLMEDSADFRPVTSPCWDVAARIEDLDKAGVDRQLISATPILFQWTREPEAALDVVRGRPGRSC